MYLRWWKFKHTRGCNPMFSNMSHFSLWPFLYFNSIARCESHIYGGKGSGYVKRHSVVFRSNRYLISSYFISSITIRGNLKLTSKTFAFAITVKVVLAYMRGAMISWVGWIYNNVMYVSSDDCWIGHIAICCTSWCGHLKPAISRCAKSRAGLQCFFVVETTWDHPV